MRTYYNEIDPKACAWLRELIKAGLISAGDVDERSIVDVRPDELRGYGACHFFAGIGGWACALKLAGWPEDQEVWTGSCPCQPLSCAGLGKGHADERHLWPAFYRHIAERRPATIFGEQVASKDGREWLAGIRADLEGMGYAVGCADLCSAGIGAPNIRQRLYWVAESEHAERRSQQEHGSDGRNRQNGGRQEAHSQPGTCGEVQRVGNSALDGSGLLGRQSDSSRGWAQQNRGSSLPLRMGSPIRTGSQGHAGNGDDRNEPGRERAATAGSTAENGNIGRVGEPEIDRRERQSLRANGESPQRIEKAGFANGGMGVTDGSGSQPRCETSTALGHGHTVEPAGFWDDSYWHWCRDGKHRRIPLEPTFFPLAPRLPGRVAMLRGFGNAINPEVAAEFIRAYLETEKKEPNLNFDPNRTRPAIHR